MKNKSHIQSPATFGQLFMPKLLTCLREGYGWTTLRHDIIAGFTVAVVALPLSMALAIASGTSPERGLFTAVVAGFLISLFGGSRVQIGGPTGAFVAVVYTIIERHGFDGLMLATMMAGIILVIMGLMRLGTVIKYIPYPVVTGLTTGIALIIFSSQVKDLLGLQMSTPPGDFLATWQMLITALPTVDYATAGVALATLAVILLIRHLRPTWPVFLLSVGFASLAVWLLKLPVETIGSRFGGIPHMLPHPQWPQWDLAKAEAVFPSAVTIAILAGIESLLSAVIADGMVGTKHRSNCELVAQGIANIASPVFGGLPATGAIARTAANIRSGGKTPVAGILHAVFVLLFMMALAPLASAFPLASLAAILVVVAWNMAEVKHFTRLLKAPRADALILLTTFFLTVLVDITLAVEVGVVLAALAFMQRMTNAFEVKNIIDTDEADARQKKVATIKLPKGVALYHINGPFFFGASSKLADTLKETTVTPRILILNLEHVPFIDATGVYALEALVNKFTASGTEIILAGIKDSIFHFLHQHAGMFSASKGVHHARDVKHALTLARKILKS